MIGISFNLLLALPTSGIIITADDNADDINFDNKDKASNKSIKYICAEYNYNLNLYDKRIAALTTSFIYYFLPVLIIVYSLLHILIRLHRKRYQVGPLCQTSIFRSVKISVMKTMSLFCSVFFVCWSMNSVINVLFYFDLFNKSFHSTVFYSISISIFYGCCAINPLLYFIRYRKIRQAIFNVLFGCHWKHGQSQPVVTIAVIELNCK